MRACEIGEAVLRVGSTLAISCSKFCHANVPHESSDQRKPPLSRYCRIRAASSSLRYNDSACQSITNGHWKRASSIGRTISGRDFAVWSLADVGFRQLRQPGAEVVVRIGIIGGPCAAIVGKPAELPRPVEAVVGGQGWREKPLPAVAAELSSALGVAQPGQHDRDQQRAR